MKKLKQIGRVLTHNQQKQVLGGNGNNCPVGFCSVSPFVCCTTTHRCPSGQGTCDFL